MARAQARGGRGRGRGGGRGAARGVASVSEHFDVATPRQGEDARHRGEHTTGQGESSSSQPRGREEQRGAAARISDSSRPEERPPSESISARELLSLMSSSQKSRSSSPEKLEKILGVMEELQRSMGELDQRVSRQERKKSPRISASGGDEQEAAIFGDDEEEDEELSPGQLRLLR